MRDEYLDLRKKLLFDSTPQDFTQICSMFRDDCAQEFQSASETRQQELTEIVAGVTIDMQSYLLRWNLQRPENDEQLSQATIEQELLANYSLLENWEAKDLLAAVRAEAAEIQRSNFRKISLMSDAGTMNVRLGHDYASGLTKTLRKGAILVTTNPPLVNMARKDDAAHWNAVKARLRTEHPAASSEELVSLLTMEVVLQNCRELRPIYEATQGKYGYVNLQINPHHSGNAVKMAEEIEWLYEKLTGVFGGTPNVVFKIPGTRAALDTAKRVTRQGIGVTVTVSFSVAQHLAFAEVIEQGNAPCSFLVMMNGRLDDPVQKELQGLGLPDAAEVAKWGSTAIVHRSYAELCKKGYSKSFLLIASLRGPWNIDGCLTDGTLPIFITSFPDKTAEYDAQQREIASHITEALSEELLKKLEHSQIFRQAYAVEGLAVEDFDSFLPVVKTLTSFRESYDELIEYVQE